ncbi:hypothetical protein D3C81_2156760 [compost metagenome]
MKSIPKVRPIQTMLPPKNNTSGHAATRSAMPVDKPATNTVANLAALTAGDSRARSSAIGSIHSP